VIVQPKSMVRRVGYAMRWVVFFLAVAILNLPVITTVLTSFKSTADINAFPPKWLFSPTLDHYREVLFTGNTHYPSYIWNSVVIASVGTLLAIALTFPAAYAIARHRTGSTWLLPIVSNLRALPLIIFAIPFYFMYQTLGLLDTRFGLALIACLVNIPLALLMLVGFIQDIPKELDEAASLDGATVWQILLHVIWPASRPILFTVAVLSFIYSWNEFLFGLILTTKNAVPVTVGATFFVTSYGVKWGATAAAMILGILPPLLLGFFAYPYIGKSMLRGAIKG